MDCSNADPTLGDCLSSAHPLPRAKGSYQLRSVDLGLDPFNSSLKHPTTGQPTGAFISVTRAAVVRARGVVGFLNMA